MKLTALITTVVLGSSSVALARPVTFSASAEASWSYRSQASGPVIRDHRTDVPPMFPTPRVRTVSDAYRADDWNRPRATRDRVLATDVQLSNDREQRAFIKVGAQAGRFDRLTLVGAHGQTPIHQVTVEYLDGKTKTESFRGLDTMLGRNQSITIDLTGRGQAIGRIIVYGGAGHGSFDVLAR